MHVKAPLNFKWMKKHLLCCIISVWRSVKELHCIEVEKYAGKNQIGAGRNCLRKSDEEGEEKIFPEYFCNINPPVLSPAMFSYLTVSHLR